MYVCIEKDTYLDYLKSYYKSKRYIPNRNAYIYSTVCILKYSQEH